MDRIRLWRILREMTQAELGELIGVSAETINRWERHKCLPNMKHLMRIVNVTGISLSALTEGEDL